MIWQNGGSTRCIIGHFIHCHPRIKLKYYFPVPYIKHNDATYGGMDAIAIYLELMTYEAIELFGNEPNNHKTLDQMKKKLRDYIK